jgi:NADH-quinone oxidoreductase subunit M
VIISTLGILLNAAYFLSAYKRIFFGELNEKYTEMSEINNRELFTVIPLAAITLLLGVYPRPFLDVISNTIDHLIFQVTQLGGFAGF